ncbi:MAG: deoxyribose-phosphate aldolase [Natronomonas sp.]
MDRTEFAGLIDHTVLGPEATAEAVAEAVDAAAEYGMNVCVPPYCVESAADRQPAVTLVTVCDFPHGHGTCETKEFEAEHAWKSGADEIDLVCSVGRVKGGDLEAVRENIERVTACVPIPVKVIVEAPLLSESELRAVCEIAAEADASYLKTATGFNGGGATVEDVRIMSEYLPVKASGGIEDFETAVRMLDAGAERIGASSGVEIVEGFDADAV